MERETFTEPHTGIVASHNGSNAGREFFRLFKESVAAYGERERRWIAALRAGGVRAAHPDDGWVDRERNTVHFAYPQFDDGADPGDFVALGSPESYRIVRLAHFERGPLLGRWRFVVPCCMLCMRYDLKERRHAKNAN